MSGRSLEFRITELADGTLSPAEQADVQTRLAADPRSRQAFDEYRRLDRHLGRTLATPPVKWDALASHLSAVVAGAMEDATAVVSEPAVAGRIAYSASPWQRRLGIAAGLVIAASAGLLALHGRGGKAVLPVQVSHSAVSPSSVVVGPQAEVARGNASVQINIGPSPALASQGGEWRYAEGVVSAPPKVQFFSRATLPAADDSHLH